MPKQEQHWQAVQMSAYHRLGNVIATLEALARGEEIATQDTMPTQPCPHCDGSGRVAAVMAAEAVSPAERYVSAKSACALLLASIQRSINAICGRRVGTFEEVVVVECRLMDGQQVLDELERYDRRN